MLPRLSLFLSGPRLSRLLALLLAAYCVWPSRESVLLPGLPLTAVGLAAALALGLALFLRLPVPPRWSVGAALALLLVKIAVAPLVLPAGWAARYYTNAKFEGAYEQSLDFRGQPWTRIDRRLDFKAATFPLHFFNSVRYNFAPARRSADLSVQYEGYVRLDRPARLRTLVATTNGVDLLVDQTSVIARAATESGHATQAVTRPLEAGVHRIDVRYVAPALTPRKLAVTLRLFEGEGGNTRQVVPLVRPFATTATQESRSRWLSRFLIVADLAVLALVTLCLGGAVRAWWRRPTAESPARLQSATTVMGVVAVGGLFLVLFVAWSRILSTLLTIPSGVDAIGYEDDARALLRGDWLLNGPENRFRGKPLVYTMGYPSMIAATHVLFGESVWPVYFVQEWMVWASVFASAAVAMRLGGWPAGLVAFAIGVYLKLFFFWPSEYILREALVVFLNTLLVLVLASKDALTTRRTALAGVIAGVNYFSDPPNLLLVVPLLWLVYRLSAPGTRRRHLTVFAGAWLLFFLLLPLRNAIVTGEVALLPTQGAVTLWLGNRPPEGVIPDPPAGQRRNHNQEVSTYLKEEPRHFVTNVVHKVCYALGLYWPVVWRSPVEVQYSVVVLGSWILTALGLTSAWRRHAATLLIVVIALIRAAYIVVYMPDYRYLLPAPMALIPLAAVGFVSVWQLRPLIAVLMLLALGIEHYHQPMLPPALVQWPSGRLLGSVSYRAQRAQLDKGFPTTTRLRWKFPEQATLWTPGKNVVHINDGGATFHNLEHGAGMIGSPPVGVPTPLIETIEIEAAFSGWAPVAKLVWYRGGHALGVFFEVDHTGVTRTYRIPVWQSREWHGTLDRLEIYYEGDTIEPKRIELVTYPDVRPRDPSAQ